MGECQKVVSAIKCYVVVDRTILHSPLKIDMDQRGRCNRVLSATIYPITLRTLLLSPVGLLTLII